MGETPEYLCFWASFRRSCRCFARRNSCSQVGRQSRSSWTVWVAVCFYRWYFLFVYRCFRNLWVHIVLRMIFCWHRKASFSSPGVRRQSGMVQWEGREKQRVLPWTLGNIHHTRFLLIPISSLYKKSLLIKKYVTPYLLWNCSSTVVFFILVYKFELVWIDNW